MNVLDFRVFVRAWRHGPGQSVGIGVPRISCPSPTGSGNVQDEGGRRPGGNAPDIGVHTSSSPTSIERPWASIGRGSEVPAREEKRPMRTVRAQLVTVVALAAIAWSLPARAANITIIGHVSGYGYQFTNFDGPTPNAAGTTINGISNNGTVVGFTTPRRGHLEQLHGQPAHVHVGHLAQYQRIDRRHGQRDQYGGHGRRQRRQQQCVHALGRQCQHLHPERRHRRPSPSGSTTTA